MTIPFVCVFVAFSLIWFPRLVVARAQMQSPGGLDNHHPRDQQAALEGRGRRAQAAHNNAFEAFAPFAAAVVIAHLAHASETWASGLAITHVVARTVYPFLYINDLPTARSTVWTIGTLATAGLFLIGFAH
jgi:uncharacterized MAPEG superfamily protein